VSEKEDCMQLDASEVGRLAKKVSGGSVLVAWRDQPQLPVAAWTRQGDLEVRGSNQY
jgi:hypothetical protein